MPKKDVISFFFVDHYRYFMKLFSFKCTQCANNNDNCDIELCLG